MHEIFVVLLAVMLLVVVLLLVLPIVALVRASRLAQNIDRLVERITALEVEAVRLKKQAEQPGSKTPVMAALAVEPKPDVPIVEQPLPAALRAARLRPLSEPVQPSTTPSQVRVATASAAVPPTLPKPQPAQTPPVVLPQRTSPAPVSAFDFDRLKGTLNWEQFMGGRMLLWIGGFALFLGVVYFVKLSFERGWIPPEVRVALGFLLGIGLVGGGVVIRRKEYAALAQTFCATGVLIFYSVTFACRAVYHFPSFGTVPTFALMALVTTAAIVLAVRLEAMVVALLGMLGGFITPVLLSTGEDAPVALFTYIALLDAGLLAVAIHRRWFYLAPLAAAGTIFMQIGWAAEFFQQRQYFQDNRILIPMAVLLGFNALWLVATKLALGRKGDDWFTSLSASALSAVALGFVFYFISFDPLAARPWLVFGFAFLLDAVALALKRLDRRLAYGQPIGGGVIFLLLAVWLAARVTNELLPAALVFTLVFALIHSLLPLVWQRLDGDKAPPAWPSLIPAVALGVMLVPVFKLDELTLGIWPAILLVDVLAVALAALTLSVVPVLVVLALTLIAAARVIFTIPEELTGLPTMLIVVGACAVFFVAASVWFWRKQNARSYGPGSTASADESLTAIVPASAVALPFLLLIMMVGRLPLPDPSKVFALAMLLTGMFFAVTRMFRLDWLPVMGLACVVALEHAWHLRLFKADASVTPLVWYLAFFAVFAAYPFVLARQFAEKKGPWVAAALAGPAQFYLVYQLAKAAWPGLHDVMGLLPATFAVPAVISVVAVLKIIPQTSPARLTQLAFFGGVALFFITLIFPIQWERQWITIGWALEGTALCWLFHRVPHPGLRIVGVGLLLTAFARLALNPAVLSYHARSETPILNWYLYTYGVGTVSLFVAARLLAPPRHVVLGSNTPPLLWTLGTVLAFLLLNIEIADFFTKAGDRTLTFNFLGRSSRDLSDNLAFAQDMTYSIAWALFALVLLVIGFARRLAPPRYAAIALLGVTVLKLFLHDLARLQQLYRIGALIGVAVIAIVASILYQRFTAATAKSNENKPTSPAAS